MKDPKKLYEELIKAMEEEALYKCNNCGLKELGCNNHKFEIVGQLLEYLKDKFHLELFNLSEIACLTSNGIPKAIIYMANGGSMYPAIEHGDILIITYSLDINIGDIICFGTNESMTIHRVIGKNEGLLICRGDANQEIEKVLPNRIVGKVSSIIKIKEDEECFKKIADINCEDKASSEIYLVPDKIYKSTYKCDYQIKYFTEEEINYCMEEING